MTLSRFRGL